MKHYTLTEDEARSIAMQYAREHTPLTAVKPDDWIEDFMKRYDKVMNTIDKYNQQLKQETAGK